MSTDPTRSARQTSRRVGGPIRAGLWVLAAAVGTMLAGCGTFAQNEGRWEPQGDAASDSPAPARGMPPSAFEGLSKDRAPGKCLGAETPLMLGIETRLAGAVERITQQEYRQAADELQAILTAGDANDASAGTADLPGTVPDGPDGAPGPSEPTPPTSSEHQRDLRARARFWLALCQERLGEIEAASANYRRVASEHPDTRIGRNALRRAVDLDISAGIDQAPPPELDDGHHDPNRPGLSP